MKALLLIFPILLSSCEGKSRRVSYHSADDYISLLQYEGENLIEKRAVRQTKSYLKSKGLNLEDFFVFEVSYPDTVDSTHENSYTLVIGLTHRKTLDYIDSIESKNSILLEEHKNEEFIPISIPDTGNPSGMDRHIYYYIEQDSVVDILAQ